jgi:hypothetical protein
VAAVGAGQTDTDAILSRPNAAPAVLRVEAREDVVIAEAVRRILGPGQG